MADTQLSGLADDQGQPGAGGGRPAYVRPVVQTYSAEEILAEFGPAMACSGTTPECPTEI